MTQGPATGPSFNPNPSTSPGIFLNQLPPHFNGGNQSSPRQSGADMPLPPNMRQGFPSPGSMQQPPPGWQPGMYAADAPSSLRARPSGFPPPMGGPPSMAGGQQVIAGGPPSIPGWGAQAGYAGGPPPFTQPPSGKGPGNPRKKRRVPIWARVVLVLLLLLIVGGGGAMAYYYFAFSGTVNNIVDQQVPRLKGETDPNSGRNTGDGNILSGGRFNILLLGSDTDQKFQGSYLAQTDIVVTVDPASRTVGMLSIPRDFWLTIPGYGVGKLDEAYSLGGRSLSRATIEEDFGIPINFYAWVGLDGFIKVIDTVGGIDVDVLHPITDGTYPDDIGNHGGDIHAYKRLYIAPGPQHLSGIQALEYVRSRHADLVGDFGRSVRQQQILTQLKAKLNNPSIFSKLQDIANDLNGYVKTDMHLVDILKLMNFARALDQSKIKRLTLGPPYSRGGTAQRSDGTPVDVVFPNCSLIVPAIARMFALGGKAACNIGDRGNGPVLASASQPAPAQNAALTAGNPSQTADTGAQSLQSNSSDTMFGLHSLLDLLFMVVFESPSAIKA